MPDLRITVNIIGDASAVEDYWKNLSYASHISSESEILLTTNDVSIRVIKKVVQDSDIVVEILPNNNVLPATPLAEHYYVQWVELERQVQKVGDNDLHVAVRADAPTGIIPMVWAEDTWNPVIDHLKNKELIDNGNIQDLHDIMEGMYWG